MTMSARFFYKSALLSIYILVAFAIQNSLLHAGNPPLPEGPVEWWSVDGGMPDIATSGEYQLWGSFGQHDAAMSASEDTTLVGGVLAPYGNAPVMISISEHTSDYALENWGAAEVIVALNRPAQHKISVQFTTATTSPIEAQPGVHYEHTTGTLTFQPGQMLKAFYVPIIEGSLPSEQLRFVAELGNPKGGVLFNSSETLALYPNPVIDGSCDDWPPSDEVALSITTGCSEFEGMQGTTMFDSDFIYLCLYSPSGFSIQGQNLGIAFSDNDPGTGFLIDGEHDADVLLSISEEILYDTSEGLWFPYSEKTISDPWIEAASDVSLEIRIPRHIITYSGDTVDIDMKTMYLFGYDDTGETIDCGSHMYAGNYPHNDLIFSDLAAMKREFEDKAKLKVEPNPGIEQLPRPGRPPEPHGLAVHLTLDLSGIDETLHVIGPATPVPSGPWYYVGNSFFTQATVDSPIVINGGTYTAEGIVYAHQLPDTVEDTVSNPSYSAWIDCVIPGSNPPLIDPDIPADFRVAADVLTITATKEGSPTWTYPIPWGTWLNSDSDGNRFTTQTGLPQGSVYTKPECDFTQFGYNDLNGKIGVTTVGQCGPDGFYIVAEDKDKGLGTYYKIGQPTVPPPFSEEYEDPDYLANLEKINMNWPPAAPTQFDIETVSEGEGDIGNDPNIDPVHLFSGEFYLPEVDVHLPGVGMDFIWSRNYRSKMGKSNFGAGWSEPVMGNNWDYSYNVWLEPDIGTASGPLFLKLYNGANSRNVYVRTPSDGVYRAPGSTFEIRPDTEQIIIASRFPERQTELASKFGGATIPADYWVEFSDGGLWTFEETNFSQRYNLTYIFHKSGHFMELTWDDSELTKIVDTVGRTISIEHTTSGPDRITGVKVYPGPNETPGTEIREIAYDYFTANGSTGVVGDLKSVTDYVTLSPGGAQQSLTTTYTYSGTEDSLLVTVEDPRENLVLRNYYDKVAGIDEPGYRIVKQEWGETSDPANPGITPQSIYFYYEPSTRKMTRVADREGRVREYVFDDKNRAIKRTEFTGAIDYGSIDAEISVQELLAAWPNIDSIDDNARLPKLRAGDPDEGFITEIGWTEFSRKRWTVSSNGIRTLYVYTGDVLSDIPERSRYGVAEKWIVPKSAGFVWTVPTIQNDPKFAFDEYRRGAIALSDLRSALESVIDNFIVVQKFAYHTEEPSSCACANRMRSSTDDRGDTTYYFYDVHGYLEHIVYPKGGPSPANFPYLELVQNHSVESFNFDYTGRLVEHYLTRELQDSNYDPSQGPPTGNFGPTRRDYYSYYPADITQYPGASLIESATINYQDIDNDSTIIYQYDTRGSVTSITDPLGRAWTYVPNEKNQVLRVITPTVELSGDEAEYITDFVYNRNLQLIESRRNGVSVDDSGEFIFETISGGLDKWYTQTIERGVLGEIKKVEQTVYDQGVPTLKPLIGYEYDDNYRPIRILSPTKIGGTESRNYSEIVYDERGLVYQEIAYPELALSEDGDIVATFDYNRDGDILRVTVGANGSETERRSQIVYDTLGRPSRIIDPEGNYVTYQYWMRSMLPYSRMVFGSPGGAYTLPPYKAVVTLKEEKIGFDSRRRLVCVEEDVKTVWAGAGDVITEYGYTPDSRLASVEVYKESTATNRRAVEFAYDSQLRLRQIIEHMGGLEDAPGRITEYRYNDNSEIVHSILRELIPNDDTDLDMEERWTHYEYDTIGRLRRMEVYPDAVVVDPDLQTDFLGTPVAWEAFYDSRSNLVLSIDPEGKKSQFVYDDLGRIDTIRQNLNPNLSSIAYADPIVTSFEYDANSRLRKIFDPNGNPTEYVYDDIGLNRLEQLIYANGTSYTSEEFTDFGEVELLRDPNGSTFRFDYDNLGRVVRYELESKSSTSIKSDVGAYEEYVYDGMGMLHVARIGATPQQTDYSSLFRHDSRGYVTGESIDTGFTSPGPVAWSENTVGRPIGTFGELRQLQYPTLSWMSGWFDTVFYERDGLLRPTKVTVYDDFMQCAPSLGYIAENWWTGGRLSGRQTASLTHTSRSYDPLGHPGYDSVAQKDAVEVSKGVYLGRDAYAYPPGCPTPGTGTEILNVSTLYSETGNRLLYSRQHPFSVDYTLHNDGIGRLIQNDMVWPNGSRSNSYGLDAVHNRGEAIIHNMVPTTPETGTYAYQVDDAVAGQNDSLNQYESISATGIVEDDRFGTFEYDDNGNLQTRYRGAQTLDPETYRYDFQNRLVEIVKVDGSKLEYEYDALGRLIRRREVDSQGTTVEGRAYIYDGWRLIEERDTQAEEDHSLRRLYIYGSDGLSDLVMMRTWELQAETEDYTEIYDDYWFHQDDMGNVIALTDESGAVVEYYLYDDFGVPMAFEPDGDYSSTTPISPFLFTGQMWDGDAKLYYCRMRWYDPYLGRFTSRDPLGLWGDPLNLGNGQAYVGHSPWSWVDPFGLLQCSPKIFDYSNEKPDKNLGARTLAEIKKQEALMDPLQKEMNRINAYKDGVNKAVENTQKAGKAAEAGAELTLDMMPGGVGDVKSGAEAVSAAKKKQWGTAILSGLGVLPLVPSLAGLVAKRSDGALGATKVVTGGTYKLVDDAGNVKRTGRTNDLHRRELEHGRDPETQPYKFVVDKHSDDYNVQRGREQILFEQHPEAKIENGGLNKRQPIDPQNPNRSKYLNAAEDCVE